jgi:polysaccharide export outer membrane protein
MKNQRSLLLLSFVAVCLACSRVYAADEPAAPASPAVAPTEAPAKASQPAPWKERFTLEAGDVITLRLFGIQDSLRENLAIGPDGRISYMQAADVRLAGLTVDEARARLDEELSKYIRNPRTVVTPVAFNSKKYYVLGAVERKGVYPFTRPITLLEAIANAGGLQTGMYDRKSVEMADLQRSILVRRGQRVTVDFEKLFQHGDLKQNIGLEPGDFLYFPPANANEIYVLGEVVSPGIAPYVPGASAISAITLRGGFTARAYKQKVLVIRGSLSKPETFMVSASNILEGRGADFKLQPRDIVYISEKPWARAEDLLDLAGRSFVQAMVVTTVNVKFDALIEDPLFE